MKIAFYKASSKPLPARIWSKLIAGYTAGPYSHCELVFDDGNFFPLSLNVLVQNPRGPGDLCFSSSEQDGGTRFKLIPLQPKHWDIVKMPELYLDEAMDWCEKHDSLRYDWRGLRGFVFPWEKPDPKDLFCSECVIECCQDQGLLTQLVAGKTSPNDLARAVGLLKPEGIRA
jgi:hypothetical protein